MANYSDIKGFTVQTLSTDTANSLIDLGTWASGGSMNTGRYDGAAGGTQTSLMAVGGYTSSIVSTVENYNGSSWTNGTAMPTATYAFAGTGASSTAVLVAGGQTPGSPATTASYEWDGSSWTSGGSLNSNQRYRRASGIVTAGLVIGGNGGSPSPSAETESYNGSAFTEVGDMNTARTGGMSLGGSGPYTASLYFGGQGSNPAESITESWDGTSWTEVADLNITSIVKW